MTIEVLGRDGAGRILLWSKINRELEIFETYNAIIRPKMIELAGREAIDFVDQYVPEGENVISLMKDAIAEQCSTRRVNADDAIGQGIWRDPRGEGLLVVSGNDVLSFKCAGKSLRWQEIDSPIVGDVLIQHDKPWIDTVRLQKASRRFNATTPQSGWLELQQIVSAWQFTAEHDLVLIVGLMVATALQSVFSFRPQVSVTGKSYTGKTTLRRLIGSLWPQSILIDSKTTAPTLELVIGANSLPVLLDEIEHWDGRQRVLELIRSSTSGGVRMKWAKGGKPNRIKLNHIIWMFAVEDGLKAEADNNRFARFVLQPGASLVLPGSVDLARLGLDLTLSLMVYLDEVLQMISHLNNNEDVRLHGRLGEVYGLPVAIWAVFNRQTTVQATAFLLRVLEERSEALQDKGSSDEDELIRDVLHSIPRGGQHTIAKLLTDAWGMDSELEKAGIRKIDDCVFIAHKVLVRTVSLGSYWYGRDLGSLLERLDGAKRTRQRIYKKPEWGVMIPMATIFPPDDGDDTPF